MPDQNSALITRDLLVAMINAKLVLPEATAQEMAQTVGESYCIIYRAVTAVLVPPKNTQQPATTMPPEQSHAPMPRRLNKPPR